GAVLSIVGSEIKSLDGRNLTNDGSTVWSGRGGIWFSNRASFVNENGAHFDFGADSDTELFNNGGMSEFINAAGSTLGRVEGTGTTRFDGVMFTNDGTVMVQSGTLSLAGGSTSTGFNVAAGATLNFAGDAFTLESTSSVTGDGNVSFSGGTTNVLG